LQPQVDLDTNKITSAEALMRWINHGQHIPPDTFVSIGEETGLIDPMTQWVINTSFRQAAEYHRHNIKLQIAINLSVNNLYDKEFPVFLDQALRTWRVPPEQIVLEITEGSVMENTHDFKNILFELKDLGVKLSLDDFGTGYSSLSYLRNYPFDVLKIDRAFVQDASQHASGISLLRAIISMADSLELEVIAEGVETLEQLSFLQEHHCDAVQGFLLGRPLPAEQLGEEIFLESLLPEHREARLSA